MWQTGRVGSEQIRAWAVGSVSGYTFEHARWIPRIGLQLDMASGDRRRAEWQINRNWAAWVEGVQYQVGDVIRRAGGLNANYMGVELKLGW